jgi:hypothetical protein
MDLLYTHRFDGFCLVSSDSDFTRLAQRLREEGLVVYGFGERKTPDAFVQACDKFIYNDVLRAEPTAATTESPKTAAPAKRAVKKAAPNAPHAPPAPEPVMPKGNTPPLSLLRQAIEEASDDEGWAALGPVGSYLTKIRPDFDPRLYGHRKLSDLFRSQPKHFAVQERPGSGSNGARLFVRALP